MVDFLDAIRAPLEREGLDHFGVVSRARYDAVAPPPLRASQVHPPTRSIVVIGSGGRTLWTRFLTWIAEDPLDRLARRSDPLDDFCAAVMSTLGPLLDTSRVIYPTLRAPVHLDFMRLAELAGIGRTSELGILVSERAGPWLGLRAAIFTPHELIESNPARRMCDECPAPCRAACPAKVVGPGPFPIRLCIEHRGIEASPCERTCPAREACIVAPDAAYETLQRTYHYARIEGRRLLCLRFGVDDELTAGR